jgi:EmrB/QacA subfamily drug resistance transporter
MTIEDSRTRWLALYVLCLGTLMIVLDTTIVNVALPSIRTSLGFSSSSLAWVVNAYLLTFGGLLLLGGRLGDLYGQRRLYVTGIGLFTVASLACGLSTTKGELIVARAVQGVGGAIASAIGLSLVMVLFHEPAERAKAMGVAGFVASGGGAIGVLLGGVITDLLSWHWIFLVNLPIGVIAVVLCVLRVSESRAPHARRPDWAGFALFTLALAALVYGLIESNQRDFGDVRVAGCLIAAAVLLIAFVAVEAKGSSPMFDLSLFRKPTFTGGAVAAFGLSASIFALLLYLVLYIQDVLGYDALATGLRLLVLSGGILLTSTIAGRLTSHVPIRYLIAPGLILVGVGLLLMTGLDAGTRWTHLIPGLIVAGAGVGLVNPPLASTAIGVVQPQRAGMASGINSTFRQVGIATGIALLGTVFSSAVTSEVLAHVRSVPALAGRGSEIATAVQSGTIGKLAQAVPPSARAQLGDITKGAFTSGLDRIIVVAAAIVLAAGVVAFFTIRQKDFAGHGEGASVA